MALPLASIIEIMNRIRPLPEALNLELFKTAQRRTVRAKEILLRPGEICNHLMYIEKGILSCWEIEEEKHYCIWLMYSGDIATAVDSFNNCSPSTQMIQAVEDCVIWTITRQNNEDFTAQSAAYGFVRQKLTDHYHSQSRLLDFQHKKTNEEYYDFLLKTYPDMVRVPNSVVASFMGISEPTLYGILKNRRKGN
jgi:CRP-like cAMP-binding protein